MNPAKYVLSIIVAAALLSACFSAAADLTSSWLSDTLVIDGDISDWNSGLVPLHNFDLRIATCNDSTYIYIAAATADRITQARILGSGLTYWFDRKGGNKEGNGLRSPACNRNPGLARTTLVTPLTDEMLAGETARSALTCEIVSKKGKEARTVYAGQMNGKGIRIALSYKNGELFQEIRVPLSEVNCDGLKPGSAIGLGIMTCEPAQARTGSYSPSPGSRDMMNGERGLQHSGMSRENDNPGASGQHVVPLEQWLSVTPASMPR
ncbi:MAG: hypothetical protein MUF22_00275 [Chitinispirillaceae bacterium]|jgi:hypothetical protein|nr:hypothetical protein [Chitinispirillaceae bacterium]